MSLDHMKYLSGVLERDQKELEKKEAIYHGSWKRRGGVGAFFVLARKWDALENILQKKDWNIFKGCFEKDGTVMMLDGGVLDQIRDLRRYLALVEAEVWRMTLDNPAATPLPANVSDGSSGLGYAPGTPEDGGHHATAGFQVVCIEPYEPELVQGQIYTVIRVTDTGYWLKEGSLWWNKSRFERVKGKTND